MSKVKQKLLDIDLDIVEESNGHQLIREGNQTFAGVKTFNKPAHSQMSKPETDNTAVNKVMLKNITRCVNTWFEESLTVTEDDITDGYIMLSKDIPPGKESSLEIVSLEGAGPMAYGVHFGAETDRLVLTGYEIERRILPGDQIMVRYAICGEALAALNGIQEIVYSPELGRFVCTCRIWDAEGCFVSIYWSDDGREWTKAFQKEHDKKLDYGFSSGSIDILGLTWNASQSQFTANCYDHDNESYSPLTHRWCLTSNDGKTWTEQEGDVFGSGYTFQSGGGDILLGADNDSIYQSQDGVTWTVLDGVPGSGVANTTTQFFWFNGYFYIDRSYYGEFDDTDTHYVFRSKDGIYWETAVIYEGDDYDVEADYDIIAVLNYMADSVYSPESKIYVSSYAVSRDGQNWTEFKPDVLFNIIGWHDGINVILGRTADGTVVLSRDGMSWWMLPELKLPGRLCWAGNKDIMLTYSDDVIEVLNDFTSNIRGVSRIPIKLETGRTLSLTGGNTGGSGGSGGSGGGSGGDGEEDDPLDLPVGDDGYYHKPYPDFPGRPRN